MLEFRNGSFHLFQAMGIHVFLHWSWLPVAYLLLFDGAFGMSVTWGTLTYIGLFVIVLLHEFGHALACRSVGGVANKIMLWPLGGMAFVNPPPRPGAVLWSIAAGPLVNVLLVPVLLVPWLFPVGTLDMENINGFSGFLFSLLVINVMLLLFNLLPIYPLDGGQMLQAILWFFIGRAQSLRVVSVLGMICAVPLGLIFMFVAKNFMGVLVAIFIGWQAWSGFRVAKYLAAQERFMNPWERQL